MNNKITNLKNLVQAYSNRKSDMEISHMLDISIDKVKSQRKENLRNNLQTKMKQNRKK
ncbi:hypothetical protein SAMN05446037_1010112 [Anaerovirgula multivorans]|uniref:Uncharacterized protein n=1 Tax=Anaerovirgula multivorans TaxID=312168 RepID=A0A239EN98_9FIRM|nr:hypothetical protein [Anaerovirgula multivorans]SNS45738.1 hypothetical protein SAMN05446037_1010112 [Anaerovirgula multivorans]